MIFSSKEWHVVCILIALFIFAPLTIANAAVLTNEVTDVPVDKAWTITFNFPVVESKAGYKLGQTYTLHITTDILGQVDNGNKALKHSLTKPFTVTEGYVVVNIQENGAYLPVANYATFDEANASLQEIQGIPLHDKFLKISAGVVATNSKAVSTLYKKATFTDQYVYAGVSADTELIYIDATEDYVKLNGFGQDLYVKQEDVTPIPSALAKGNSYYIADENGLRYYIYHHQIGKYDGPYVVGKKPSFLNEGEKYYSTDGANFTDANGKVAGTSYAYFQLRVPTSYTAESLMPILIARFH